MKTVAFATQNQDKYEIARDTLAKYKLDLVQQAFAVDEIQGEDNPEIIAVDKAQKAYLVTQIPTLVTDDSWSFHGLRGFPGPYMHSMNHWLTAQDFLRLTKPLKDRRVTMTQYLVYIDGSITKVFQRRTEGYLLNEIKGSSKHPSLTVTAFDHDDGLSVAEALEQTKNKSTRPTAGVFEDFAKWYL